MTPQPLSNSFRLVQQLRQRRLSLLDGKLGGGLPALVAKSAVGPVSQKESGDGEVAGEDGAVERCRPVVGLGGIGVGAALEKQLRHFGIALAGRTAPRRSDQEEG